MVDKLVVLTVGKMADGKAYVLVALLVHELVEKMVRRKVVRMGYLSAVQMEMNLVGYSVDA
jgi:hypothetical protein